MSSSMIAKAARVKPEIRLAQSISQFEAGLSNEHKATFRSYRSQSQNKPPDLSDVMRLTAEIDRRAVQQSGGGGRCFGPRLTNILQAVQQYVALGDVIIGGSQNIIACGIWSLFRLTLLALVSFSSYMEKLSRLLMVAGRKAPRYEQMTLLYPQSSDLQTYLSEYFINVVQLCHQLYKSTQKSKLGSYFSFLSDQDLKEHETSLQSWADCIMDEVKLLTARKITEQSRFLGVLARNSNFLLHQEQLQNRFRVLEACSTYEHQETWTAIRKRGNSAILDQLSHYSEWKAMTSSSTLLCTGKLGFGKSVLLANMVDEINLSPKSTDTAVIYFFCRYDIQESLRARTIIGSIAQQLIRANLSQVPDGFIDTNSLSNLDDLLDFISSIISRNTKAFLVLDGLDECDDHERDTTLRHLKRLQEAFTFKICCSLRSDVHLREALDSANTLLHTRISQLPEENPDISIFVTAELEKCIKSGRLCISDPKLLSEIQDALVHGAQGMFLWTILQIESLCNAYTDLEIREALEKLPKGLPETFSRILEKCRSTGEKYQRLIFQLCLVAQRPLTTDELQEALSVVPYNTEWDPARRIHNIFSVLSCCGSLVTVDEDELTVRFLHQSVKQYLLGKFDLVAKPILTEEDANHTMGELVVTYMNYNTFENAVSTTVFKEIIAEDMPSNIVQSAFRHSSSTPVRKLTMSIFKRQRSSQHDLRNTLIRAKGASSQNTQFKFYVYAQAYWLWHVQWMLDHQETKALHLLMTIFEKKRVNNNDIDDNGETILSKAVEYASSEVVKHLLDYGCNAHTVDKNERTPLHLAATRGSEDIITFLLNRGAVTEHQDKDGRTAASIAAYKGHLSILESLLDKGTNVETRDNDDRTPLLLSAGAGRTLVVAFLLNRGANITATDYNGWTALHWAASLGHHDIVQSLLDQNANIDEVAKDGLTPLLLATAHGHKTVVQCLVARGASITAKAQNGNSALRIAVSQDNDAIVYLLLGHPEPQVELKTSDKPVGSSTQFETQNEAGTWKSVEHNSSGPDPRMTSAICPPFPQDQSRERVKHTSETHLRALHKSRTMGRPDLYWAVENGHEMLAECLIEFGADTEVKDTHGATPLLRAAADGHCSIAKLLLNGRANVNAKTLDGKTALHISAEKGRKDLMQLLLRNGRADVHARTLDGKTALHISVEKGREDLLQLLLKDGRVDIHARTQDGRTILHISAEQGHKDLLQLLLKDGRVDIHARTQDGRTALHISAEQGHKDLLQLLLKDGRVDIHATTVDGRTALHILAEKGHEDLLQLLQTDSNADAHGNFFTEFQAFVEGRKQFGMTCEGQGAEYVPLSSLREFWTEEKIDQSFASYDMPTMARDVRQDYLLVFSTLVYVSPVGGIYLPDYFRQIQANEMDDHTLPWLQRPEKFFAGKYATRIFDSFTKHQWMFCPVIIDRGNPMSDTRLNLLHILPITIDRARFIGPDGGNAELSVVYINAQGHSHHEARTPKRAVMKCYQKEDREAYEHERRVHEALHRGHPNVVEYLGSFRGAQSFSILLEYAEEGTLDDLFKRNETPHTFDEIQTFWKSFLGLVEGLEVIDNASVVHRDLNPSNVFVFKTTSLGRSSFAYTLKIGNFGNSYVRAADSDGRTRGGPRRGESRIYDPPGALLEDSIGYQVSSHVDIWGLGCIFIESAVWVAFGERGRAEFRESRMQERGRLLGHNKLGHGSCFHDGVKLLPCVEQDVADKLNRNGRKCDGITSAIVDLMVQCALTDMNRGHRPRQLLVKMQTKFSQRSELMPEPRPSSGDYLRANAAGRFSSETIPLSTTYQEKSEDGYDVMLTRGTAAVVNEGEARRPVVKKSETVPTSNAPLVPGPSTMMSSTVVSDKTEHAPITKITIKDLTRWIDNTKRGFNKQLPGWESAKKLLAGRDFLLLIDNSKSMQEEKSEVLQIVKALAYLLKKVDRDGIEVVCTSSPSNMKRFNTAKDMENFIKREFHSGHDADCAIELALNVVLEKARNKYLKQSKPSRLSRLGGFPSNSTTCNDICILVLTNGQWDSSEEGTCGAGHPILRLINEMNTLKAPRTRICLRFVRFGNSETGKQRLKLLDDNLSKMSQNTIYDIIDCKSVEASIWDILIGPLSRGPDETEHP